MAIHNLHVDLYKFSSAIRIEAICLQADHRYLAIALRRCLAAKEHEERGCIAQELSTSFNLPQDMPIHKFSTGQLASALLLVEKVKREAAWF